MIPYCHFSSIMFSAAVALASQRKRPYVLSKQSFPFRSFHAFQLIADEMAVVQYCHILIKAESVIKLRSFNVKAGFLHTFSNNMFLP